MGGIGGGAMSPMMGSVPMMSPGVHPTPGPAHTPAPAPAPAPANAYEDVLEEISIRHILNMPQVT